MEFIIFMLMLGLVVYLVWLNLTDHSRKTEKIKFDDELELVLPSKYSKKNISDENAITIGIIFFLGVMLFLMLT